MWSHNMQALDPSWAIPIFQDCILIKTYFRSLEEGAIEIMLSFWLFTLNDLDISWGKNKYGPTLEGNEVNMLVISKFYQSASNGARKRMQGKCDHLPSFSLDSFVLLSISGLRIALTNFRPLWSPFSYGFWISLFHLKSVRYYG